MKAMILLMVTGLLSAPAFSHGVESATNVELVREVLLRGLEVDGAKIAKISAKCKGSSLELTVKNEATLETKSQLVHFVGGVVECSKNLDAAQPKLNSFYNKQIVNLCNGSSLLEITVDSNLNFENATPRYVGAAKCLQIAAESNAN